MNHIELHDKMSTMLGKLEKGQVKEKFAKEFFNGAGKIINNAKGPLFLIGLGYDADVPLYDIKKGDLIKQKSLKMPKPK